MEAFPGGGRTELEGWVEVSESRGEHSELGNSLSRNPEDYSRNRPVWLLGGRGGRVG